jgi:exodeoxyribonuclease-3
MSELHLVSWNVNGIRAILKKDFIQNVNTMNPDVICLQEIKAQPEDVKIALSTVPGFHFYTNSSKARKGYSGTAILSKTEPISITYDMGIVITAEFEQFFIVTVYTPNSGEGMKRLDYREEWDTVFREHVMALDEKKPVVVCGDLNVAHNEIDLARPKPNYNKTSGYTQTEINGLENLLSVGFFDSFRSLYPDEVKYSWWNYKFQARERNVGWRIDYFLLSDRIKANLKDSLIYNEHYGSDHCPVAVRIDLG